MPKKYSLDLHYKHFLKEVDQWAYDFQMGIRKTWGDFLTEQEYVKRTKAYRDAVSKKDGSAFVYWLASKNILELSEKPKKKASTSIDTKNKTRK